MSKQINYESDFKLKVGYSDGTPIVSPFRFTFYTKAARGTFVAQYDGNEYTNCYPDEDGMVKIPFDHPSLGMGVLSAKIEIFVPDSDFEDGKYDWVSVENTGIVLDKGVSEAYEDMEVLISKPDTKGISMYLSKPYTGEGTGGGGDIPNGSVTESKLANGAVSTSKIKDGAVTMAKLGSDVKKALEATEIADGSITEEKLSEEVREKLNQGGGSGEKGEDGKSAYDIWLEQGNEGSEQDFLDSLKGEKGEQGEQGEKGAYGERGEQGIQGEKGDKMTYADLTEEEKNDLASRVDVDVDLSGYVKTEDIQPIQEEVDYLTANMLTSEATDEVEVPDDFILMASDIAQELGDDPKKVMSQQAVTNALDVKILDQTESVVTIQPNILHRWGVVDSLDITLAEGKEGVVNEYIVQFTSGENTTLTLPNTIKWLSAPSIEAGVTYQLSIVNNLAIIGGFKDE